MGIKFQGDVTIYGNVEVYSDRSMKIAPTEPIAIPLTNLEQFIERKLKGSPNKQDYLDATDVLKNSTDTKAIQKAVRKIMGMAKELGRNVAIKGLSVAVVEAMKALIS